MMAGSDSESARTLPEESMMVARALSTRWAKRRVFWVRLRSISARSEASQALPIMTSRMTEVAAMTIRKTARSLKKMRFFTFSSRYGRPSLRGLEAVSGAADSLQVAGILGIRLDFFTDAADVDIDRAGRDVGRVAPDGVEKVVAAENASFMSGEVVEETKFRRGGGDRAAANGESHGRGIDLDIADLHGTGRR